MFVEVLPTLEMIAEGKLKDRTCIIIDVFRATSTIVTAVHNGCAKVIPVATIDEAWEMMRMLGANRGSKPPFAGDCAGNPIIAGERGGRPIPGFDLGNSPLDYTPAAIMGKTIVMTTTNGTAAITGSARHSGTVLIGSMLNAQAVAQKACTDNNNITIVCAGTMGRISMEDTLTAGTIIREILLARPDTKILFDHALLAYRASLSYGESPETGLADAYNAKRLATLGKKEDICWCSRRNKYQTVPVYSNGIVIES